MEALAFMIGLLAVADGGSTAVSGSAADGGGTARSGSAADGGGTARSGMISDGGGNVASGSAGEEQVQVAESCLAISSEFRILSPEDRGTVSKRALVAEAPMVAFDCDVFDTMVSEVPQCPAIVLRYDTDFYITPVAKAVGGKISPADAILLGTTNAPGAGSGECVLYGPNRNVLDALDAGDYYLWAVRKKFDTPDARTKVIRFTLTE